MRKGVGNTMPVTSPSTSLPPVKLQPCSMCLLHGVMLTAGPCCQPQWVFRPGARSYSSRGEVDFSFIYFLDVGANFKNLYLELGVSKWGDPNFAGFIMKCSI